MIFTNKLEWRELFKVMDEWMYGWLWGLVGILP